MKKHKSHRTTPHNETAETHAKAPTSPAAPVSEERIRQRAYEIFQTRGDAPGHELDDWLLAEIELKTENDFAAIGPRH